MHIGFLTPEYPLRNAKIGGLGTYVRKTALELYQRGHKVSVFLESDRNGKINDDGVTVYEIKCPNLYYGLNSHSTFKQLIRVGLVLYASLKVRYKVLQIHQNNPLSIVQSPNYLAPGFFLRKNKKIPVISRTSSYAPLYHAAFGIPRTLGDYLLDYLELKQVSDVYKSFSPSRFTQRVYDRYEFCNLDFIKTPIEQPKTVKFDPSLLNKIQERLQHKQYLLYFGSLSRIKGVDLMADVINKLAPKHPHIGFVFVGLDYGLPNGKPLSEFIYEQCSEYKERILFYGFQSHKTLYPVIKNALCAVAPSRVDNYPNTCLEAQSLGIPVIGTSDSSIDELVVDGKTGFIADNSSSLNIASKIEILLNMNKKERLEMKQNIAKNIFDILKEDRTKTLLHYYEKTIREFNKKNK